MSKEETSKEVVYTDVLDRNIKNDLTNSPIWKDCLHSTDIGIEKKKYKYHIKFAGLTPVQFLKAEKQ